MFPPLSYFKKKAMEQTHGIYLIFRSHEKMLHAHGSSFIPLRLDRPWAGSPPSLPPADA